MPGFVKMATLDELPPGGAKEVEYEGRIFGSLSSVANEVTGGNWNGFVFFRLARSARHGGYFLH